MKTPKANRKHIVFYGNRNVGKSSLMNSLIGQEISLVSEIKGTTTDVVSKAVELLPYGPVVFVDTGGIDDEGTLGSLRVEKTIKTLESADLALYVLDIAAGDFEIRLEEEFKKRKTPYIIVINKIDLVSKEYLDEVKDRFKSYENIVYASINDSESIANLKEVIIKKLQVLEEESTLIGDLVPYEGRVILVIPLDEAAPRGRLILPQVQVLRDCLDHGIKSYVVRDMELKSAIEDMEDVDLVITDSKAFKYVDSIIPREMKLTSFSILMARQKGDLGEFLKGIERLKELKCKANPKILVMESCSHNVTHDDIGRVKIPRLIENYLNKNVDFNFAMGNDFPEDLRDYDLVIHCGSCMLNRKTMVNRIRMCKEAGVPITNYGLVLAHGAGILDRAVEIFKTSSID